MVRDLRDREKELMEGLVRGLTLQNIAARWGVPTKQARSKLNRIVRYFGARTREHAIAIYLQAPAALNAISAPRLRLKLAGNLQFRKLINGPERAAVIAKLYESIQPGEGCWLWIGKRAKGYPVFEYGKWRFRSAHRLVYELERGPIGEGLFVCHDCDTPPCVRVNHLWLGTHAENMADMAAKGRSRNGRSAVVS